MYHLTNKRGYTLTELMVTVAIVGIVAAMAVPSFISYLPHLRLNGAARDLISDLRLARSLAVGQNQRYKVFFSVDANNEWYEIRRSSDNTVIRRVDYRDPNQGYTGVDLTAVSNIEFDFNGTATKDGIAIPAATPATITVGRTDGIESKNIRVTRFGRVYVE